MIIDFHTHCFPDTLAERAVAKLAALAEIPNETDGTVSDLICKLDDWEIDRAVVLNIATNVKQQENVNTFAIETKRLYGDRLFPLGSLHPSSSRMREDMIRLKENGIHGIKLHPDYMRTTIDDEKFHPVFALCCEYDMFVIIHAGFDVVSPDFIHATPRRILSVLRTFPTLKLIAAHMGANACWDDVEHDLVGKNIYFDTSLGCVYGLAPAQAKRILENHDPDKLLFGSDAPWCKSSTSRDYIESLELSTMLKEKIFHENAERLLQLQL